MQIIDTHIHLFDPTRPQGVPWPPKTDPVLYKPALPDRYRALTAPFGIAGAIEIECSPWLEDNQWVLDLAAKNPIVLGMIGDLEPGKPGFAKNLERFHRNPLFLGIRYGNLWDRSLAAEISNPGFIADMKLFAQTGLSLDTANPDAALVDAILRLTDQVPNLRVVMDHLPQMDPKGTRIAELAKRPHLWVKVSQVLRHEDGRVPTDVAFYRDRLDLIWNLFGEDRLLYGSDWPNSDLWAPYPEVFHLVRDYFAGKSQAAQEKYFHRNSEAAYHYKLRTN